MSMDDTMPVDQAAEKRGCAQRPARASANSAMAKIQQTLEWEACDEDSAQFLLVAGQLEEAFEDEARDAMDDASEEDEDAYAESSQHSDSSYESSFVTNDSGSEYDTDSELEWQPNKRPCAQSGNGGIADKCEVANAQPGAIHPDAALIVQNLYHTLPPDTEVQESPAVAAVGEQIHTDETEKYNSWLV